MQEVRLNDQNTLFWPKPMNLVNLPKGHTIPLPRTSEFLALSREAAGSAVTAVGGSSASMIPNGRSYAVMWRFCRF